MDLFMPVTLENVYQRLNFMDPAVKGRMGVNRWGGSGDIGGSPRETGTRLHPEEIVMACRDVVERRSERRHLKRFVSSIVLAMLITVAAIATAQNWEPTRWLGLGWLSACAGSPVFGFHVALLVLTAIVLAVVALRRPWQFGIMRPIGTGWWRLMPIAILCGLTGEMQVPDVALFVVDPMIAWTMALVLIPLSQELLFRSLIHGMMAQLATIQDCQSRWFISGPTIGSTIIYATVVAFTLAMMADDFIAALTSVELMRRVAVAAILGVMAGMIRERSHSIVPAWLFHATAIATMLLTYMPVLIAA
jgi:membrane protease YdiL (CAAX protease family)